MKKLIGNERLVPLDGDAVRAFYRSIERGDFNCAHDAAASIWHDLSRKAAYDIMVDEAIRLGDLDTANIAAPFASRKLSEHEIKLCAKNARLIRKLKHK